MMKLKNLWGFRSGVPWKSLVVSVYYFICILVFAICMFTPPLVSANLWDTAVLKLSILVIFLWMMSPALFLSNTAFRDKLPLFKKHVGTDSIVGMLIVFFLFSYLFTMSENLHTPQYREEFRQYIEASYDQFAAAGEANQL